MKIIILFLVVALFSAFSLALIQINEIMYDPGQCSDTLCEWVELHNRNETAVNLTNCLLEGKNLTTTIPGNGYLIAARNVNNFTAYFGPVDNIIPLSFSLTNSGDTVTLNGTSYCNDTVDYTPFTAFANGNNKTLEKDGEGNWRESRFAGGTPGRENSVANISSDYSFLVISEVLANPFDNDDADKPEGEWIEILNYGDKEIHAGGMSITDLNDEHELFIAASTVLNEEELFVPPGGYIVVYRNGDSDFSLNNDDYEEVRLFAPDGQLINFMSYTGTTEGLSWSNVDGSWYETNPTPEEDNEYTGECIWFLYLDVNNSIYRPDDFSFSIMVSRLAGLVDAVTVRGQIEEINGNIVQSYAPWTNVTITSDRTQKYSPHLAEGVYQASFWFEEPPCLDINPNLYRVNRLIAINPQYQQSASTLAINSLNLGSDQKVKWGEQFDVKLEVYKGNATRSSISAWVEKEGRKVSDETTLNAYDQYQHYSLTIPVQLIPNCDGAVADGAARVLVEGLGLQKEQELTIEGRDTDVCQEIKVEVTEKSRERSKGRSTKATTTKTSTKNPSFQLLELPASLEPGGVLRAQVQILNDVKPHEYQVWSYIYRGNKCYTCQESTAPKEANVQKFRLDGQEAKVVDFLLKVDDAVKEGEYKIKVKINKDNQKTNKELTNSIYVLEPKKEVVETKETKETALSSLSAGEGRSSSLPRAEKKRIADGLTGFVVYESSAEKGKKVVPYLLLVSMGLVLVIVLWKK